MTAALTIEDRHATLSCEMGHGTDPLWPLADVSSGMQLKRPQLRKTRRRADERFGAQPLVATSPAAERLRAQLPPFAPLLEELEIAGWSSHRQPLSGNFHDWMLLGSDRLLVTVGRAAVPEPVDPIEAALVSQAAWAAVRAARAACTDAGAILSLASQTLWAAPAATLTSLGVALVDTAGGNTSVALAGDCLAWRVRAATCERLAIHQPPVGTASTFNYLSQSFPLALRERLILVADDSFRRSPKAELALTTRFSHLDAESHRRMAAADAVALVRKVCEADDFEPTQSTSIAAVRRR